MFKTIYLFNSFIHKHNKTNPNDYLTNNTIIIILLNHLVQIIKLESDTAAS